MSEHGTNELLPPLCVRAPYELPGDGGSFSSHLRTQRITGPWLLLAALPVGRRPGAEAWQAEGFGVGRHAFHSPRCAAPTEDRPSAPGSGGAQPLPRLLGLQIDARDADRRR